MNDNKEKILVAYFSHKGMNYLSGSIKELKKGNTEIVAEEIASASGAKLFEIAAEQEYPFEYADCVKISKKELGENARPALKNNIDISEFDVIFLGYPNWCGTMPMPVFSFLDGHDFGGKTVVPFCTNEGSGLGRSEADLKKAVPSAVIKSGLSVNGTKVSEAKSAIREWVQRSLEK